ncbi:ATP-dependent DNA helicase RecG [compost metagenome]
MNTATLISKLHQALVAEARRSYPNVQGQRARFSEFVFEQLGLVSDTLPHAPDLQNRISDFRRKLKRYDDLTPIERSMVVDGLLGALSQFTKAQFVQPSATSAPAPSKPAANAAPSGSKAAQPARSGPPAAIASSSGPLDQAVQYVKGVGPKLGELLGKIGILSIWDLLYYFPRTHLDYKTRTRIRDLEEGQRVTLWGSIQRVEAFHPPSRPNMCIMTVHITDGTGRVSARWFQGKTTRAQIELFKKRYPVGAQILVSGEAKFDEFSGRVAFDRPDVEVLGGTGEAEGESIHVGRIVPVYPLTEGLHLKALRKAMHAAVDAFGHLVPDPVPVSLLSRHGLIDRRTAIRHLHFPESTEARDAARSRLVFDELLMLQLGLAYRRAQVSRQQQAIQLPSHGQLVSKLMEQLPFELTGAQKRVFDEVRRDLAAPEAMNRLVQGDVGSGKTVVALLTLLVAVENGYQGALMAPTEILAEQHFRKFQEWLEPMGIPCALLLGRQGKRERGQYLQALKSGYTPIVVGTHALIQEGVEFQRLGLVVIDEQHRFGVRQRALLRAKGLHPEVLTMTATPIPRTLALTMHGDLDVSVIDELPSGRKPIQTSWVQGKGRKDAYELVRHELQKGRQAYVVFPLIEEGDPEEGKQALRAATEEAERLQTKVFPEYKVGLLHGKMPAISKDEIITAFRNRELDILVATTVVEVGVDVPNASVMIIENAERFGLSQLHQLRGRVGRGAEQSYCVLVTDSRSDQTRARMEVMVATNDGFIIAEQDLKLRGPGEFLGTRQSGMPDLVLADLVEDTETLEKARVAAFEIISSDPELTHHPGLKADMLRHFRSNLGFLGIG